MFEVIDKAVIDFIGDHKQVMFFSDLPDLEHHFTRGDRAGGVGWITDKDTLGARRDGFADVIGVNGKIVFDAGGHFDRHAARQNHFGLIRYEAGRGDDDFVAGFEDGNEREIQRLRNADGCNDLVRGIVFDFV